MITAIWGCGGTGKSAIACGLGNLYAARGTAAVIDTNLCQPTLPLRLPGVRLEAERSLGRYLNRLGDSEVRRYYHQHPDNKGLFFAGMSDRDAYTDFEIGLEAADRAREFLVRSGEMFDHVLLDCSVQRNDPFLPAMLRHAGQIVLPIVPGIRKKQRTEAFEILTQDALRMAQQKEELPSEESQQLLAATQVAGLSPAELDVLRKFFYEERDMREIAQEMRISLRGAYVIKDRALKKLRKALLGEG